MRKITFLLVSLFIISLVPASAQDGVNYSILDAGVLYATSGELVSLVETFSLTKREDGSHKLISTIIDPNEQVKSQDLTLDEDFKPIRYLRLQSSPPEDERTIKAEFVDNRAIVTIEAIDDFEQQTFTTETEFIVFDDSAVSQLATMLERFINVGDEILVFDALFPENLGIIPSEFSLSGDITLRSGTETFEAQDYLWTGPGGALVLRILELDGRFIGGIQERSDGTLDILYRQDLYPEGFEVIDS